MQQIADPILEAVIAQERPREDVGMAEEVVDDIEVFYSQLKIIEIVYDREQGRPGPKFPDRFQLDAIVCYDEARKFVDQRVKAAQRPVIVVVFRKRKTPDVGGVGKPARKKVLRCLPPLSTAGCEHENIAESRHFR